MSDLIRASNELEKRYTRLTALASSNLCAHCGLCTDACHYYRATGDPSLTPVAKTERVRSVLKRRHDWLSRLVPAWTGARALTEAELDHWQVMAFRDCTLCERCVVNCPLGVDTPAVMQSVRGMLTATGRAPEILVQLADAAIERGRSMDLFKDLYLEQIAALEQELQAASGDPDARIPVEQVGAQMLYVALAGAHTILPAARIFHAAGASWTLSMFEASNYGVFLGDPVRAKAIAERIVNEAKRLRVQEVVISECGHAYATFRWAVPNWFGPLPFRVRSILEVLDEYLREGRILVDPHANPDPVTYHDPCNLARKSGIVAEPRAILRAVVQDFRDMTPRGAENYCCGGGAGLVAVEEWREARLASGRPKAEQIRATGASAVASACDNCRIQIGDLAEHYGLGVQVVGVSELVARALLPQERSRAGEPAAAAAGA